MFRRARLSRLLALVLAVGIAGGVGAEDEPEAVEATLEWEPGRVGPSTLMLIPFRAAPPKGLATLDDLRDARYARIRWGDSKGLTLALDVAPGHERLWIDLDLDGDLSDETHTRWFAAGSTGVRTERVRVAYADDDEGADATVPVRFSRSATYMPDKVHILPWTHRRGAVTIGGRQRIVALVDGNADLRFDDPKRDRLYLDVDGDGRFQTTTGGHEHLTIGEPFRLRDAGWIPEVPSPSGRVLRFVRAATAPPAIPRTWRKQGFPAAGRAAVPPTESFEELKRSFAAERDLAYAKRMGTVSKLGRLGTKAAFDHLVGIIEKDEMSSLQSAAARALGNPAFLESGGKRVVALLKEAFVSSSVKSGLVQALHGMDHPERYTIYRDLLASNDATVTGAAAKYLVYLGTEPALDLVRRVWAESPPDSVRYQIYLGLRTRADGPPRPMMIEAAEGTYATLAAMALRDLYAIDHPRARELALAASRRDPPVEYHAKAVAEVLGAYGDERSVEALLDLAARGTAAVQLHVARQLAPVRDPGAVDALVDGLKAKAPTVRGIAAQILAGIPLPRVTKALQQRVKREKDVEVLASILEALGDHGGEESAALLLKQARRRKSAVRHAAIRALARLGLEQKKVRAFFETLLGAKRWEDRVLAIDAVAFSGNPALCRKVLPSLGHDAWQVRLAAAEAVGRLRCPAAIVPLINRLEREEEIRITDVVAEALYRITGMNLYDDVAVWRKWWKKEGAAFVLPETVKDLPPADAGGTSSAFYGIPVKSGRVIFVIDQSGSMSAEDARPTVTEAPSGNRLDVAVRQVLGAVKGMKKRDFVNVIFFQSTILPWQDALTRLTAKNRSALEKHLGSQKPMGGTNLYDGLELALADDEVDTIFLLSDGVPGLGKHVAKDDILRAVKRLNQTKRVAIHTVSIGRDSALMRELAEENGGKYVRR